MKLVIVTHVPHIIVKNKYFAYAPYVREMNIWAEHVGELIIVSPVIQTENTPIDISYNLDKIKFYKIEMISLLGLKEVINAVLKSPKISWQIFKAMRQADHIHLRCPGNIGLLGCLVQILFPSKPKTAKYAGNWDPKSKQPWSYRLQKWILSNTFLTRNMQVLVYGEWEGSTKNVKPFFTATYAESDKVPLKSLDLKGVIRFVFVGTLSQGKNPLYAIQLVAALYKKGYNVRLDFYGEGIERKTLEHYIESKRLEEFIQLKGNQNQETIKKAYQNSHFVLLPSKSEGWPKAIAEGMFWGCVPIATPVSCVPFMLDYGRRGILLQMTREICSDNHSNLENDVLRLGTILNDDVFFEDRRKKASDWSRKYTLDVFEEEIKQILRQ